MIRGKIITEDRNEHEFLVIKTARSMIAVVYTKNNPLIYTTTCGCLEPIEFLGIIIPKIEEKLGNIKDVILYPEPHDDPIKDGAGNVQVPPQQDPGTRPHQRPTHQLPPHDE